MLRLLFGVFCYRYSKEQRAWRLDDKRVQDFATVNPMADYKFLATKKIAGDLKELSNPISGFMLPIDPEFEKGKTYDYRPINNLTFGYCVLNLALTCLKVGKNTEEGRV